MTRSEPRRDLYAHMDAANVDLKAFTQDFYHRVCAGHLDDVLQTLEYLRYQARDQHRPRRHQPRTCLKRVIRGARVIPTRAHAPTTCAAMARLIVTPEP